MSGNFSRITVQVRANAKRGGVVGFREGTLRINVSAPPVQGKANRELVELLSEILGVARSNISIERGKTSKTKVIAIEGLPQTEILKKLGVAQAGERNGT
ncbi:MAG: DUF167 domain-containing protein [Dehalococcoidia bacterium]